jgi:hypothetical protein
MWYIGMNMRLRQILNATNHLHEGV